MALFNLRRVATATTGTGTITLGSAVTGFKNTTDAPAIPDQTWVTYAIADTSNSEIGYGLYSTSGPTLTRNVIESTNSNTAIALSGGAQVFITPSSGDIQSDTAFPNRIYNGSLDVWQKGTGTLTITTGLAVTNAGGATVSSAGYTADGWIVVPTGASVTAAQAAGRSLTAYSLKVTGNTSVTDIVVKQRIESLISAPMTSQQIVFQAWVYNNTSASITPTLTVKHPNSADNYAGTTTDVSAVSLQACPNAAWTQVIYTFTASSSSANGMEVSIDFGNNFSTNAKYIQLTEVDLRVAPGYPSGLTYIAPEPQFRPVHEELVSCQRYYAKSYSQSVDIGTSVGSALGGETGAQNTGTNFIYTVKYPQTMRSAVSSFTAYDNAGAASKISANSGGGWANATAYSTAASIDKSIQVINTVAATVSFDWTASAEL